MTKEPTASTRFVILRGLVNNNRFFTSYSGEDPTKLADGTVGYEVIGYASTVEEAQIELYGRSFPT